GDEQSDIEILPGFFKAQVWQLAAALGVPREILDKAPSADLFAGQTDEDELGFTYDQADLVLYYSGDQHGVAETKLRMEQGITSVPGRTQLPSGALNSVEEVLRQRDATRYKRLGKPTFAPSKRTHT